MSCRYCGTELPEEAVFCPECGHAVSSVSERMPAAASTGFSIADLAFSSPDATSAPEDLADRDLPDSAALEESAVVARCPQCGEPVAEGDIFCGECGFVLGIVAPPAAEEFSDASAATSIIVLPDLITLGAFPVDPEAPAPAAAEPIRESEPVVFDALDAFAVPESVPEPAPEPEPEPEPAPAPEPASEGEPAPQEEPEQAAVGDGIPIDELVHDTPAQLAAAAVVPPSDPDLEFDEPLPFALPIAKKPTPTTRSRPIPDPFPWGTDSPLREDIEATRLIADMASGTRFVLQFSTGESVTVLGSGLVGRNPSMQPGEYVDQLVPIFDAGKSVSKTHLEYGQEGGRFWISDRYSTNGSTIRQPDTEPRRADPGRRYFVARGTRVDLGEQFFVVS